MKQNQRYQRQLVPLCDLKVAYTELYLFFVCKHRSTEKQQIFYHKVYTYAFLWVPLPKIFFETFFLFKSPISHCLKTVQIRSFSGPYFPELGLNTEIYSVIRHFSHSDNQFHCQKIHTCELWTGVKIIYNDSITLIQTR